MHLIRKSGGRALADLCAAFAVGIAVLLLNLSIQYVDPIHDFFHQYRGVLAADWLVNSLLVWLALLLAFAFCRWRRAARRMTHLENVISSISPDTLVVVEPDRTITLCNQSVRRAFGYEPEEVVGQTTDRLYFDRRVDPTAHPREIYDALRRDGFHVGLATGRRRNGETFPLEIISAEIRGRGGAVLLLRDISERVKAEAQRRELEACIRERQKIESLGVLAGGVAHDFNNLLTVIMGNTDLAILALPGDSPARPHLESVREACCEAAALCRQMLAYAGKASRTLEPVRLSEVVRTALKILEASLDGRVQVVCDLADDLPRIEGDRVQLQQVVMNLVLNAAEAVSANNGLVTVRTGVRECDRQYLAGCVIEAGRPSGRFVFFEVSDNGCGMDEATRARIFDPFFTTKKTGRGLGLASVLGIVRSHQGTLRVASQPGQGSTFTVLFVPMRSSEA